MKKIISVACVACVYIATFIGKKTFESQANETGVFHVKKIFTWIHILSLIVIMSACGRKREIVDTFPIEKELLGERINALDSVHTAFSIYWNNGKLYLSTKGDYHLTIYDEKENKVTKSLRKGHGHEEWIAPMMTTQQIDMNGQPHLCVLERAGLKLYGVNPEDSCAKRYCLQDFRKMDIPGIRSVFLLSDSSYWGIKDCNVCDMFHYDVKSKKLTEKEIDIEHSLFSSNSQILSQNMATYCPQIGKIAIAYYSFPYLLIMEEGKSSAQIQIQVGKDSPVYNMEDAVDPHSYVLDICSTDKYIYILYDDPSIEDKTAILVFDWNGAPIARYRTDRMNAFTVDEDHSRFIALNEDDSDGICSIYRFSK